MLKVTIKRKNKDIEEALLDTWLDDEPLEKEGKETKPGAAPDGKCKPERGDFACYFSSENSRKKQPKKIAERSSRGDPSAVPELVRIIEQKKLELDDEGTWQVVSSNPEMLTDFFLNALRVLNER